MKVRPAHWFAALLACTALGAAAPAAQATFGVSRWEAGTCKESTCTDAGSHALFYTQAAGHPDFGITDFAFNYREVGPLDKQPEGKVKDVRVDLPAGLAVNPEATEQCSEHQLDEFKCPAGSQVGEDEATGTATVLELLGVGATVTEHFPVYNMVRQPGQPARFGVEINSPTLAALALLGHDLRGHIYLEAGLSWHQEPETSESSGVASGDYHEFFKIENLPEQPEIIESKLVFWGVPSEHTGIGTPTAFLTMPSSAAVCAAQQTTYLHVDSYEDPGHFLAYANATPVTATGCEELQFNPSLSLDPQTSESDRPDGASVEVHIPQFAAEPTRPDSPDLQDAEVTLPEGMTLNPSAAHGLEGCTDTQIGLGTDDGIECPAGSNIGSVAVDAPGIPNGSLVGSIYLGSPEPGQGPESGREFRIFLAAEAPQYGVGVRLEGHVRANAQTGQLTATFTGAPQVPFEDLILTFRGGPRAPLANPLGCGPAEPSAALTPYTGQPAAVQTHGFVVDGEGPGGECPTPLPFSPTQTTPPQSPPTAGAYSPFTLDLARGEGQQYLARVQTTLPPGLLGAIPAVVLCPEPQADAGTCPSSSEIGTTEVLAGAGGEPYAFAGHVYLTGPYGGAPYGLSIVVPAIAGVGGLFNFGDVVTRAGIDVGLYNGRLTVTSSLPTVVEGVPLRLRSISVAVSRPSFLLNPTTCAPLATESLLTSTFGAMQSLSTPFQVGACGKLAFTPKLTASTDAKTSRAHGASLEVKLAQGSHQADIRQVLTTLPKRLPTRQSTLRKACPAATFEAGGPPGGCTVQAQVGDATATTPVLAGELTGPVYLVSHGGAAFPDLDVILRGDGVTVVLVGHTHISSAGVTTASFESLPDVPVSSFSLSLPVGPHSALSANGNLCRAALTMPTTIVAQDGARVTQTTRIAVKRCPRSKRRKHSRRHGAHRRGARRHRAHARG